MKVLSSFLALTLVSLAADAPPPKAEEVAKSYKTLPLLTPSPVVIQDLIDLCGAMVIPELPQNERLTIGPHRGGHINHYRNLLAQISAGKTFSAGSVFIKEKLTAVEKLSLLKSSELDIIKTITTRLSDVGEPELRMTALAGMIKRPAGTHPKSGDWEFFWFENGKLTTAGLESCAGCHSGAKKDYVFTDFSKK